MRNLTNRLSFNRLTYIILLAILYLCSTTFLCYFSNMLIDQYICVIAITICFLLIFVLNLIHKRLDNLLPENKYVSYGKNVIVSVIFWIVSFLSVFIAPDFFAPVIIIPLIASAVYDDSSTFAISLYHIFVITICQNYNMHILLCYSMLVISGVLLSHFIKKQEFIQNLYGYICLLMINTLFSIVFYYFDYLEINTKTFFYAIIDSAIAIGFVALLLPFMQKRITLEQAEIYDTFLDPDYALVKEIHKFSYIEFQHACRVSRLAHVCALAIGVNEKLAAAAGFYYRLGKLEGEPMIDNAIKIANDHCFPEELIQILFEYGAIISLPSCPESAIVHMVDSVVTKVELFDSDSMTSTWNQNMVIYQTINELSQKGLYDKSNLSMNQFLTIRDVLTKEDILS